MTTDTPHVFHIKRLDLSTNKSLRAFSAADEMLLDWVSETNNNLEQLAIYHDRFGFLTAHLMQHNPITITTQKSQKHTISSNFEYHKLPAPRFESLLTPLSKAAELAIMKLPKSLDLFELMLWHVSNQSQKELTVVCGFMTRHFSKGMIEIAEKYFGTVTQSRAAKKARLLIMEDPKPTPSFSPFTKITYNDFEYQQYKGVFSGNHIDYATQFLLTHINVDHTPTRILDLASGNGVIAKELSKKWPSANYHLVDDSELAVASAQLNFSGDNVTHLCENQLTDFENNYFDLIVSNPPFHFEHDININVPITLFSQAYDKLKDGGELQLVANTHLNYATHLVKLFKKVNEVAKNDKYVVYSCVK